MSFYRHKRAYRCLIAALALAILALSGCTRAPTAAVPAEATTLAPISFAPNSPSPSPVALPAPSPALEWSGPDKLRYVFLFIGDGMGKAQVRAVSEALAAAGQDSLVFQSFPVQGEARTDDANGETTDSAAAGTAIATGEKTLSSIIGLRPDGQRAASIAETLHTQGFGVGILTTVPLDHATPACFYAHVQKRTQYDDIMLALFESGFEYFAGGGFAGGLDAAALSASHGVTLLVGEDAAERAPEGPLVCLPDYSESDGGMAYAADRQNGREGLLGRYVARGITRLAQNGRFFLMAEGGRIDQAAHFHDAGDMCFEVLDFDAAVREAVAFYEAHPHETLIVITADHETGDLSLAEGDRSLLLQQAQSCRWIDANVVSLWKENAVPFGEALPQLRNLFPLGSLSEEEAAFLSAAYSHTLADDLSSGDVRKLYNGVYSPIVSAAEQLVAKRAGLAFASFSHTGANVPVYALGVGADTFAGTYENTEIHQKLIPLIAQYR